MSDFTDKIGGVGDNELLEIWRETTLEVDRRKLLEPSAAAFVMTSAGIEYSWLAAEYNASIRTLGLLGLGSRVGLPTYEQVYESIDDQTNAWLAYRKAFNHADELIIVPDGLSAGSGVLDLAKRYDAINTISSGATIVENNAFWEQLQPTDDEATVTGWRVGFLLGDVTSPRDLREKPNLHKEKGLVFTDMSVAEQLEALEQERQEVQRIDGVTLQPVQAPDLIIANAKHRSHGTSLINRHTFTRLVQHPGQVLGESVSIPKIGTRGNRVVLGSSVASFAHTNHGVRRIVELPVTIS